MRKTLPVADIITRINNLIPNSTPEERKVLCHLAECYLHDSNSYRGFLYNGGYHPELPDFDDHNRSYNFPHFRG